MNPAFGYNMAVVREALALCRDGLSYMEIARSLASRHEHAPHRETIGIWVRAAGIMCSRQRERLRIARARQEVYRLVLEEAYSINAAALVVGVSYHTAHSAIPRDEVLSRGDAVSRCRRRQSEANRAFVIALRKQGRKYAEISKLAEVANSTVIEYLREAGLTKQIAPRKVAA